MLRRRTNTLEDERALLSRAARWSKYPVLSDLTADVLREISGREGIDFATALLYDRVVRSLEYGPLIARLESMPSSVGGGSRLEATVVIVPGAFYRDDPRSGADGRLVREAAVKFGYRAEFIPLASFGTFSVNARSISDWLARRPDEPVILVSLSKGGADVKMALLEPNASQAFRNVVAWINLSGLLQGTPLVTRIFASRRRTLWYRLLFRLRGFDFRGVGELAPGPAGRLDFDLRLPAHLQAIHVVGFPLARHMSNAFARRCFRRLKPLGPNDGSILLAEVFRLPGIVYPIWGADHYLRPAWGDISNVAVRVLHFLNDQSNPLSPRSAGSATTTQESTWQPR